ncbi:hypothetical protein [uncultured Desulfobulbus sp.]|uniref:hypothetical protein n=1 Tax=uncultured Desulfobulbus sp. TaxID=239745 RepID=UPI0029C7908E|nr:hypothetical protein [uncultured Desulfobulbus sp.]
MTRLLGLLLLCLVAGGSSYLLIVHPSPAVEITEYLPVDTLALAEWENFAQSWEGGQYSAVGEKSYRSHFFKVLAQFGLPEAFIEETKKTSAFLENFTQQASFQRLFGKKVVLALLPTSVDPSTVSSLLLKNLVVILQFENDIAPQQGLQEFLGPVQSQKVTVYQGESLVTLVFREGYTLSYWLQPGVLICAQDAALVQRCIDQTLQRKVRAHSGLQLNAAYQRLKQQNNTNVFFYTDLARLQHQLPILGEIDTGSGGWLPRHLALFHHTEAGVVRLGLIALVGEEAMAAFTAQHQLPAPADESATLQFFPETEFSLWTNWFKAKKLWDFGLQSSDPDVSALLTSVAQQLSEATGRPGDTFFNVFGSGLGVFINEQVVPHQANRSMGCLAIEVRDRPAVLAMIKQLVANLQVITVKSEETEISSVMLAEGLLQPAYALVGNYLLLADSVELIEQGRLQIRPYLDGGKKEEHRVDGRGDNLFLFVRTGDMVKRLMPFLTLLAKENGERTRILPPESRLLVRELGLPLLSSLLDITTSRLRGSAAGDTIRLEVDYSLRQE